MFLFVTFLPATCRLKWGNDNFANCEDDWSLSSMVATPSANALFAIVSGAAVLYVLNDDLTSMTSLACVGHVAKAFLVVGWVGLLMFHVGSNDFLHSFFVVVTIVSFVVVLLLKGLKYGADNDMRMFVLLAVLLCFLTLMRLIHNSCVFFYVIEACALCLASTTLPFLSHRAKKAGLET